jgi:hypothetical protein
MRRPGRQRDRDSAGEPNQLRPDQVHAIQPE